MSVCLYAFLYKSVMEYKIYIYINKRRPFSEKTKLSNSNVCNMLIYINFNKQIIGVFLFIILCARIFSLVLIYVMSCRV